MMRWIQKYKCFKKRILRCKARDVMSPRTELVAIDLFDTIAELKELFIETGYSKVVVYENSLDDIVGYVHSFDLFKKPKVLKLSLFLSSLFLKPFTSKML
jgi:CBS domain containing-hemolysin-like protein